MDIKRANQLLIELFEGSKHWTKKLKSDEVIVRRNNFKALAGGQGFEPQ